MRMGMLLALSIVLATGQGAFGQQEPVLTGDPEAAPPATSTWASRCISTGRQDSAECSVSLRAVNQSGQVLGAATVRVAAGSKPVMLVTVPLGIYIPAGVHYNVDGAGDQPLDIQTCDRSGCYASGALADAALAALQSGKTLNLVFEDTSKRTATLPLSLNGFTAAYQKAK